MKVAWEALTLERPEDDPLRPVVGIVNGCLIEAAAIVILIVVVLLLSLVK